MRVRVRVVRRKGVMFSGRMTNVQITDDVEENTFNIFKKIRVSKLFDTFIISTILAITLPSNIW